LSQAKYCFFDSLRVQKYLGGESMGFHYATELSFLKIP